MKTVLIGAMTFMGLMAAPRVEAAVIYSTTDLGTSYQLQTNAGGQVYGVANSNGSVVYAFDKSPVTSINLQSYYPNGALQYLTMQNGAYQVGYVSNTSPQVGGVFYPTFEGQNSGWFLPPFTNTPSPISDINSQGQVVGTSRFAYSQANTYAAFSDPNVQPHVANPGPDADASVKDNLNTYIATIPGVTLTSAMKIDDLGRILAVGSDGHDYLLTPTALGSAATVPEPSTAMVLGLAGSFFGLRSIRRRLSR